MRFGVFFFKQKTAYEIGTGDWSSDVCSSDLEITKLLIGADADVNLRANTGQTALHHAAKNGRMDLDRKSVV